MRQCSLAGSSFLLLPDKSHIDQIRANIVHHSDEYNFSCIELLYTRMLFILNNLMILNVGTFERPTENGSIASTRPVIRNECIEFSGVNKNK